MLIAARRAVEFASGLTHEQLRSDLKTQSAILHRLLVLGEAAKHDIVVDLNWSDSIVSTRVTLCWPPRNYGVYSGRRN